jgi:arylsulfatase A-like enzyme
MTRAVSAGAVVATAALVFTSTPLTAPAEAARNRRPNVLIILTDDQRTSTLRHMSRTRYWFKRGGTEFTHAFATTPLCCPSRASIFTGRYAHNHGVKNNRATTALEQRSTLQRYLRDAGYRTAIFGKFLNGWGLQEPPHFDEWATFSGSKDHYLMSNWNVNGRVKTIERYSTDYIKRRAVRFLRSREERDRRPWLMYLNTAAPHYPYIPERDFAHARVPLWKGNRAVHEVDRSDKPPFVQAANASLRRVRRARREQLRTLMSVDEMVDRVMRAMAALDEKRTTLAVFMSDNGYLWGEHGLSAKVAKRPPYTPSVSIPLLVRWPGHLHPGTTTDRLVANIDVAPTALQAAGVPPSPEWPLDGRSLVGVPGRDRLLLEYWIDTGGIPEWASLRTRSYQYTEYYGEDGLTPVFREYYDVGQDPSQLHNLLGTVDPGDDPAYDVLSDQLAADRGCDGTDCP